MRAFIAIDVPYFRAIGELQRSIEGRFKAVEPENIHFTLKFLGEIDEGLVGEIKKIIEECRPEPFTIKLKGIGFFPSENYIRVVWIGVENPEILTNTMRCIDQKTSKLGFRKERSYVPHLTVARVKGRITIANREKFEDMEFGEIEVREIKLKKSTLTEKGPIYEDILVVPLQP